MTERVSRGTTRKIETDESAGGVRPDGGIRAANLSVSSVSAFILPRLPAGRVVRSAHASDIKIERSISCSRATFPPQSRFLIICVTFRSLLIYMRVRLMSARIGRNRETASRASHIPVYTCNKRPSAGASIFRAGQTTSEDRRSGEVVNLHVN